MVTMHGSAGGQGDERLPYLPGLDGLRALAVTAVVLYHAGLPLPGGFLGVEIFFTLSGFLITSLLLAEWQARGTVSLRSFWLRRARRLLPALGLVLVGTLTFTAIALRDELPSLLRDMLAAGAYVTNWYLIGTEQPYFDATLRPPLLQHLWSLAIEEQFYLLWPLLFLGGIKLFGRRGLLAATLLGAVGSTVLMAWLYVPGADPTRVYYGTDTRAAGLLIGAALALLWSPARPAAEQSRVAGRAAAFFGLVGIGGLVAATVLVDNQLPELYQGGFALVALLTVLAIVGVTHAHAPLLPQLLSLAPLRWLGTRSYSIYLWHWPVFMVTRPFLDVPLEGTPLFALRLTLVLLLAELSYRLVERPVRAYGLTGALRRIWQRRAVAPVLVSAAPQPRTRTHQRHPLFNHRFATGRWRVRDGGLVNARQIVQHS